MKNLTSQNDPSLTEEAKALLDQQIAEIAHRARPFRLRSDQIALGNRAKTYKRRRKGGLIDDGLVDVVATPEGRISKHEKLIITLLRTVRPITHWSKEKTDGEHMRTSKARGSILAIYRMTGEEPPNIMVRLGLTPEEIARIHPFTCTKIWT